MAASRRKKSAKARKAERKPLFPRGNGRRGKPRRWHHLDDDRELLDVITSNVQRLLADRRRDCYAAFRELLLDRGVDSRGVAASSDRRAMHNIVRNAVEAITADHAKDLARPMLVPVGGDWKLTRKVKATQRALDGDWERLGADAYREAQIHDACTYGEGHIRVYPSFDRVAWRRVKPWCLLSERREDSAGRLMTRYEVSAIDVDVLIETFAVDEDGKRDDSVAADIEDSDAADTKLLDEACNEDDGLILVMEAWRLPLRPGAEGPAGKGRHIVCTSKVVLYDAEWTADFFPHSTIVYSRDPESTVTGPGLPERMARMQYDQNETDEIISDNKRLIAGAKVVVSGAAEVDEDTFTNESGLIIKHNGTAADVQVLANSGNAIDLVQNARMDRLEMLTDQGINPMQTSGQLPEQVDSGKAQQVYRDNTKARHAMVGRQCERSAPTLAKCHILAWEQIVDAGMKPVGMAAGRRKGALEPLNYNDVRLSSEQFDCRTMPVSDFSDGVAGRFSEIQSLVQAGWMGEMEGRRLMNLPDVEESNDVKLAGQNLALDLIDAALDIDEHKYAKGLRVTATRVCDRTFLIERGWQMHASIECAYVARLDEAKREELNRDLAALRDLIGSADTQLKQEAAKAQAEAQAAAAAAAPPQPPMAPPPQPPGPQLEVVQ